MSAVEAAIEKVRGLDEVQARELLGWFAVREARSVQKKNPLGAHAMVGFARRFRKEPRSTESWMQELRAGEE
jgi:hypothetical protein